MAAPAGARSADRLQIRSDESGTIARLHMDLQPVG